MTLAQAQGSAWALGGDFNLTNDDMQKALREFAAPPGWDKTVMALGEKENAQDGLWVISGDPVEDRGARAVDLRP